MTSLSLRNRRTTLCSMLQRTSWSVRRAWMSDSSPAIIALLSACAFFVGGHPTAADDIVDTGTRTALMNRPPEDSQSGSPRAAHADLLEGAPAAITGPVRKKLQPNADISRSTTRVRAVSRAQKMERGNTIDKPSKGKKNGQSFGGGIC